MGTEYLPRIGDWTSFDELHALQDERIPRVLERAARSPFYRETLGGSASGSGGRADLLALPRTTKQNLRDSYPFGLLATARRELATYHESSGTAGTPTPSFYSANDWVDLAERFARKWNGITEDDTLLVRTPYALMITGHLAHAAARSCGATVVPGDNRSLAMPYSRVVRVLHDLRVTLTWSMPTETLIWAAAARAAGHEPLGDFPALRALYVGGEPLTAVRKERISSIWGVPVIEEYGSTETGSLAGECPYGHLHLWSDRAIFEVRDPVTGRIAPDGTGHLVVTPLFREAMPIIRYDLEDDVEVEYADCSCGWNLPRVRVLGRAAFGHPVGSARVTQHELEELVFGLPSEFGVLFWRARALPERVIIEIEVAEDNRPDACEALIEAVTRTYRADCLVSGLPPGTLMPATTLTATHDVVKPRSLFGPGEDWDKALLYH